MCSNSIPRIKFTVIVTSMRLCLNSHSLREMKQLFGLLTAQI